MKILLTTLATHLTELYDSLLDHDPQFGKYCCIKSYFYLIKNDSALRLGVVREGEGVEIA